MKKSLLGRFPKEIQSSRIVYLCCSLCFNLSCRAYLLHNWPCNIDLSYDTILIVFTQIMKLSMWYGIQYYLIVHMSIDVSWQNMSSLFLILIGWYFRVINKCHFYWDSRIRLLYCCCINVATNIQKNLFPFIPGEIDRPLLDNISLFVTVVICI